MGKQKIIKCSKTGIKDVLKAMRKVKKKFKSIKGRRKMVPEQGVALQKKKSPENSNYIGGKYKKLLNCCLIFLVHHPGLSG